MAATPDVLKSKARALLDPEIAATVEVAIEADAQKQEAAARTQIMQDGAGPTAEAESIATVFLGDAFYDKLGTGRYTSRPIVQWNGMDSFILLEDKANSFSYTTAAGRLIKPRSIPTDGGSTPRILHGLRKFSPWGYGPAFIIHDWLFYAHRNKVKPDDDWQFEDTAKALGECIKCLMAVGYVDAAGKTVKLDKDEDTVYLIYQAVRSQIAKGIWDSK
jgi:hypothetical protein